MSTVQESPQQQSDQPSSRPSVIRAATMGGGMMFQPSTFGELMEWAKLIAGSGMVPKAYINNPGGVIAAVQMGAEVGLSPMASLQNIAVINGRPSLWGDAILAIIKTHPDFVKIVETWDDATSTATCVISRRGQPDVTHSFGWEDAKRALLLGKDGPWQTNPKRMCQMRARGFAARDQFPDALRGISSAEESEDIVPLTPQVVENEKPRTLDDVVARAKPAVLSATGAAVLVTKTQPRSLEDVVTNHEHAKQTAPAPTEQAPPPTDADAPAPRASKVGF